MSLNLTLCEGEDGPDIELWQTPTFITQMCLSYDAVTGQPDGGHEAVRKRYIFWVKSQLNGVYDTPEDFESQQILVESHVTLVQSVKDPRFSYI